ncbi:hypothetical protein AVEN_211380-1 [Araneus ventricosus]|uniref:Uncharacterized protein n=1 Tax=Araneus ventricosus TaxID=182803 RepID=A0A4Y2NZJ7_ARAVE|nr:hypothetical protein AVEN_211380-1 [Araneus ventricosus]
MSFISYLDQSEAMYQIIEESTDKVKVKFWEAMKEVFDINGDQSRGDFEMYKVTVCNYTDEGKSGKPRNLLPPPFTPCARTEIRLGDGYLLPSNHTSRQSPWDNLREGK